MRKLKTYSVIFLMLLSITACGGGDTDATPTDSSDWDSMVWDQDNWS